MAIRYHSTNRFLSHQNEKIDFPTALLRGIAPDEGLYMPDAIPTVSLEEINSWRNKSYAEVAFEVIHKWLQDEISAEALKSLTQAAYTFTVPLETVTDNLLVARLDQGPTASFKDFAAQIMARLVYHFQDKTVSKTTVLVATSGDTGGAVGAAFGQLPNTQVIILYPTQEVSSIQKRQLDSLDGNVTAIAIDGKFDDCQSFVKMAFSDKSLSHLNLTSANSINIGRVLPQIVYYFYTWLQTTTTPDEQVIFCIPSGNLGNSLGCELARRMGLPIKKIIIATNANKSFPDFLKSGNYHKISPSINSLSNAMNVGNPSNLARYFDLYGGTVDKNGVVHRMPDVEAMRKVLSAYYISDVETVETIKKIYEKYQVLLEPHGAVGIAACLQFMRQQSQLAEKIICMETAHPAKFPEAIQETLHINPQPSDALLELMNRTGKAHELPADYEALRNFMAKL
jgi:threonine synthase